LNLCIHSIYSQQANRPLQASRCYSCATEYILLSKLLTNKRSS